MNATTDSEFMRKTVEQVYDLNANADSSSRDYLIGVNNLKRDILKAHAAGDISVSDKNSLVKRVTELTSNKSAEATKKVSYRFGEARKVINTNLPPELRGEAIRELFYATLDDKELEGEELKAFYRTTALEISDRFNKDRRDRTLQAVRDLDTVALAAGEDEVELPAPTTKEEYDALPVGTVYLAPNGQDLSKR